MDNRMLILPKTMKHSWHHLFSPMPWPVEWPSPTPPAEPSVYIPDPNSANVYVKACHTQITHTKYSTVQICSTCTYLLYTVRSLPEHHGQGWKLSLHCESKRLLLPSSESRAMILSAVSASTTGGIRSPDGGASCVTSFTSIASSVSDVSLFFIPAR